MIIKLARFMTQELTENLLEIMVCPLCSSDLVYDKENQKLICYQSKLAYAIIDGIPNMLIEDAESLE